MADGVVVVRESCYRVCIPKARSRMERRRGYIHARTLHIPYRAVDWSSEETPGGKQPAVTTFPSPWRGSMDEV